MLPVNLEPYIYQTTELYKCASLLMWFVLLYTVWYYIFIFAVLERWLIYDCETECNFVYLIVFNIFINNVVVVCIQCDINLQQQQQHLVKTSSWKRVVTLSSWHSMFNWLWQHVTVNLNKTHHPWSNRFMLVSCEIDCYHSNVVHFTVPVRVLNCRLSAFFSVAS